MFLMIETKLNIVFAISLANYIGKNLGYQHIEEVNIILQYFKESKN